MALSNTATSYGLVARVLHWLTALLILTTFPLGLIAENLPYDTAEALARKAQLFSVHKTLGVAVFFVALTRILWALIQPNPAPLHPERRAETFAAGVVHWALYISLVAVPLTGWIHHAAVDGFAPILWPFGQNLPFVPKSELLGSVMTGLHYLFAMMLAASLALHILGAVKHAVIDRDGILSRMVSGRAAGKPHAPHSALPAMAAVVIYLGAGLAVLVSTTPPEAAPAPVAAAPTAGNWQVAEGTLGFTVTQMGSAVTGSFANWSADITFDDTLTTGPMGQVKVTIDTGSLTLGSVTAQAKEPEFFDVAKFPEAVFTAQILPGAAGYEAQGTLTLRGAEQPVTLPFTLQITGDTATMTGEATIDRRDFGMGASYGDESSVGFAVTIAVTLTAKRN